MSVKLTDTDEIVSGLRELHTQLSLSRSYNELGEGAYRALSEIISGAANAAEALVGYARDAKEGSP